MLGHSRLCRLQEQQGISPQAKKMPALQKTQSECSPLNTMATDHGVHAPSKPVFSPSQMPQARHIRDEHSRLGRSNSHSDVSSAAASRPTFFGSSSVGQEQRQRRTSTSAPAAAPSPTPKARNPMAPARVPTPIRSSSRNSIHRPASASLDFGHCKPALNVFSRESSWMPARHGMVAY